MTATHQERRTDPDYRALLVALSDVAEEFGDEASLRSSATRAYNLLRDAGVSLETFLHLIDEAVVLTRSSQSRIRKRRSGQGAQKNLMPYFFRVLDSLAHPDAQLPSAPASHANGAAADTAMMETLPVLDTHAIWRAVLEDLRLVITPENFNTWLAGTRVVRDDDDLLEVGVEKPFHKQWLEHKLHGRVMQAVERLGYGDVRIAYVVVPLRA